MRKTTIIIFMFILSMFLSACKDEIDEGYKKEYFPDDKLGSVVIPEEWIIENSDGWTLIKSKIDDSIIAVEYEKCNYCYTSINSDIREYNPFFENYTDYTFIDGLSGNSNLAQLYQVQFSYEGEDIKFYMIEVGSRVDSYFDTTFVFIDRSISVETLEEITKSYVANTNK